MKTPKVQKKNKQKLSNSEIIAEGYNKTIIYRAYQDSMHKKGPATAADFLLNNAKFTLKITNENTIDDISTRLEAKDHKIKDQAKREMLAILENVIKQNKTSDLNIGELKVKLKSAEEVQAELNETKARDDKVKKHKKAAKISRWVKSPKHLIKGPLSLAGHWVAAAAHATIIPATHSYYALTTKLGMKDWQSNFLGASMLASTTALSFSPVLPGELAAEAYTNDIIQDTMLDACKRTPMALDHPLIAAFLVGTYDPNSAPKTTLFRSAVTAMEHGANPAASYAIAAKETGEGKDVINEGSGAQGVFQSLTKVSIQWLTDYADQIDYAGDLGAKEDVQALITYRKEHGAEAILELEEDGDLTADLHNALSFARRPEISAQLVTFETLKTTPTMSLENYLTNGIDSIKEAIGTRYHTQLLGPYGGAFLLHLAENYSTADMTKVEQINRIFQDFRTEYKKKTGRNFPQFDAGNFYKNRLVDSNAPIFKNLTVISAANYSQAVKNFALDGADKRIINGIKQALTKAPTAAGICSSDPSAVAKAIPETITPAQLAYMQVPGSMRKNVGTAINWTSSKTSVAFALTASRLSDIYNAMPSTSSFFPANDKKPEDAHAPQSIDDLIREIQNGQTEFNNS